MADAVLAPVEIVRLMLDVAQDGRQLRNALGRFATGVTVITILSTC